MLLFVDGMPKVPGKNPEYKNIDSAISKLVTTSAALSIRKKTNSVVRPNGKGDLELIVKLLKSVLKLITIVPIPELVGGKIFFKNIGVKFDYTRTMVYWWLSDSRF